MDINRSGGVIEDAAPVHSGAIADGEPSKGYIGGIGDDENGTGRRAVDGNSGSAGAVDREVFGDCQGAHRQGDGLIRRDALKDEITNLKIAREGPNVVQLYEVYEEKAFCYLVMELMEGGELLEYIIEKKTFTEREARSTTRCVLGALAYMHDKRVAHRDIKPENVGVIFMLKSSFISNSLKCASTFASIICKAYNPKKPNSAISLCLR